MMKLSKSNLLLRLESRIPAYYVSLNGQIKFYNFAGMLLESAARHADLFGFGYHDMNREKVYWVLSRLHVIMHAYPLMDQTVYIETWPKGPDKLFFKRDYRMLSGNNIPLASATTSWLVLDGNTGRPKKFEDDRLQDFNLKGLHAIGALPGKLPGVSDPNFRRTVKAHYSDLDFNRHVNAVKYIEWIQDLYDENVYRSRNVAEFQINYQLETRFGEEVEILRRTFSREDPFEYVEGIRKMDGNTAFRAKIKFDTFDDKPS
jgi:acyl-ACP thioesterase